MSGPAPKPNEVKRKQGNPGKKALPNLASVIALPQVTSHAPEHLSDNGKQLWQDIRERATWIADTDQSTLQLLCEKLDRRAEYQAKLQSMDLVLYTDKGYAYANPVVGMLSTIENEIAKLFSVLGLTPSDRSKLGVAEVKKMSALDELIAKRNQAR